MNFKTALLIAMLLPAISAIAGEMKTVTLSVDKITCAICLITVKMALKNVDGVAQVIAKYEGAGNGWAKVTYDADKTDIEDLTFATEMAGYPSRLKQ
jgi:mercuric ion binding protein